jgi:acetyltransferase-like isoleucine patch superfamily enzyme
MSIHPTAIVSNHAKLGMNVSVGAYSVINDNVVIGDNSVIGTFCELGSGNNNSLQIGPNAIIRSHCIVYGGSILGSNFVSGHHVTIRENSRIGNHVQVGTLGDIQGDCVVGDYTKLHSNVHIGKLSNIGKFVWIFPYVVLTNDPHPPSEVQIGVRVDDFVVIATMAVVLPGINLGEGALIGAGSVINQDIPSNQIAVGNPCKVIGPTSRIRLRDGSEAPAYPWRRHFHRNYPEEIVSQWVTDFNN